MDGKRRRAKRGSKSKVAEQLELTPRTWGGRRKGAGRKPGRVEFLPRGASRSRLVEVRVDIDQRPGAGQRRAEAVAHAPGLTMATNAELATRSISTSVSSSSCASAA